MDAPQQKRVRKIVFCLLCLAAAYGTCAFALRFGQGLPPEFHAYWLKRYGYSHTAAAWNFAKMAAWALFTLFPLIFFGWRWCCWLAALSNACTGVLLFFFFKAIAELGFSFGGVMVGIFIAGIPYSLFALFGYPWESAWDELKALTPTLPAPESGAPPDTPQTAADTALQPYESITAASFEALRREAQKTTANVVQGGPKNTPPVV